MHSIDCVHYLSYFPQETEFEDKIAEARVACKLHRNDEDYYYYEYEYEYEDVEEDEIEVKESLTTFHMWKKTNNF